MPNQELVHAPNCSALSAINGNNVEQGATGWVKSVRDEFRFERPCSLVIDGITVLSAAQAPDARWVRKMLPHPSWALQTSWSIDSNANPENDGSPAHPVPALEYYRRTGPKRILKGVGQISIDLVNGNVAENDPLILSIAGSLTPSQIVITGKNPTILATGTLASWTGRDPSNDQFDKATNTNPSQDWTPFLNKLVRFTSGAHAGLTCAWLMKNVGDGSVLVNQPYWPDPNNVTDQNPVGPVGNETYEILELQSIGKLIVDISPSGSQNMDPRNPVITMQLCKTPGGENGSFAPNQIFFRQCELYNFYAFGGVNFTSNCSFSGDFTVVAAGAQISIQGGQWYHSFFFSNGKIYCDDFPILIGSAWAQSTSGSTAEPQLVRLHGGLALLDCAPIFSPYLIPIYMGSQWSIRGRIWGTGNTGPVFGLSGGRILGFAFSITPGASGGQELVINGKTSVRAFDDTAGVYTEPRACTTANLNTSVAAGGFGGAMFDPASPANGVFLSDDA